MRLSFEKFCKERRKPLGPWKKTHVPSMQMEDSGGLERKVVCCHRNQTSKQKTQTWEMVFLPLHMMVFLCKQAFSSAKHQCKDFGPLSTTSSIFQEETNSLELEKLPDTFFPAPKSHRPGNHCNLPGELDSKTSLHER